MRSEGLASRPGSRTRVMRRSAALARAAGRARLSRSMRAEGLPDEGDEELLCDQAHEQGEDNGDQVGWEAQEDRGEGTDDFRYCANVRAWPEVGIGRALAPG